MTTTTATTATTTTADVPTTPPPTSPTSTTTVPSATSPVIPEAAEALQAAAPRIISSGHLDLIEARLVGDAIEIAVKDDSQPGGVVFRRPSEVAVRVRDRARIAAPGGEFSFLGAAGSSIWVLPQVQDPELVWPGWSTERMGTGQVAGDVVGMRLTRVEGPGALTLFTTDQFGQPTVLFRSADGLPDEIRVPIRTHAHANWAFSAAGAYRFTVEVTATPTGRGPTSATATYLVLVGDATTVPSTTSPSTTSPPSSSPPTTARPTTARPTVTTSTAPAATSGARGGAVVAGAAAERGSSSTGSPSGGASVSAGGATSQLPATGDDVAGLLVVALSLVASGAGLLAVRRRLGR